MPDKPNATIRAFLSHSWNDKALARRVARRLSHRGVPVWVDENEMQIGTALSDRLSSEIRQSSHFLVLLTDAAGHSRWVTQETDVATSQPHIVVLPLIAEEGIKTDLLDQSLGISIADPWTFEERLDAVAGAILGRPVSAERNLDLLKKDLAAIGRETPELRGLIEQLLRTGQLTIAQLEALTLDESQRHPTETALIALHECAAAEARYVISLVAASCFRQFGVGYEVMRRQIAVEPAGSSHLHTMFIYLGNAIARTSDIEGARRLFDLASPPMDQSFADFVRLNFDRFTQAQRDWAVRFITIPDRGPHAFACDAAFELYSRLPDNNSLRSLWFFWVNDYKFGGKHSAEDNQSPSVFFALMNEAVEKRLTQFDAVMDCFQSTFRRLARAGKRDELRGAIGLLYSAANSRYVRRKALAGELEAAIHTAEWDELKRDDELVEEIWDAARAVAKDEPLSLRNLKATFRKDA